MKIIKLSDKHCDDRRDLMAWDNEVPFGEITVIIVKNENQILGNHSHPYDEKFLLLKGECQLLTWNPEEGRLEYSLQAPCMFIIPRGEEHVFKCNAGTILVSFSPQKFSPENLIKAKHL